MERQSPVKILMQAQGFTLLEVLVAILLFSVFISVFYLSRSNNLNDIKRIKEDLKLHQLCERKLNSIIINLPPLTPDLALSKQTSSFDDSELQNYEATVEYQKLALPDFSSLLAEQKEAEKEAGQEVTEQNESLEKKVLDQIQENLEKMLWQIRVTVKNKETKREYSLSTWVKDEKAKIQIQF